MSTGMTPAHIPTVILGAVSKNIPGVTGTFSGTPFHLCLAKINAIVYREADCLNLLSWWHEKKCEECVFSLCLPFNAQEDTGVPFHRNFNSILRKDHQKNFLWASRLWVGRRNEPILGYVPKNDEKKNLAHKGLNNPLQHELCFQFIFEIYHKRGFYRLPTIRHGAHRIFFPWSLLKL